MTMDSYSKALHKRNAAAENERVSRTKMMLDGPISLEHLDMYLSSAKPAPKLSAHLTELLIAKGLSNDELAVYANIGRSTVYKIMSGKQLPEQDLLLRMAFVLGLTGEETQQLLKTGHRAQLTAGRPRDIAIIYGLQNGLTLDEMDSILMERGMAPLTPVEKNLSETLAPLMKDVTLKELLEKACLNSPEMTEAINMANITPSLESFDIISDILEKDDLLRIGFMLHVKPNDMQHLLRIAQRAFLNVKDPRDQEILSGLASGMDLDEINAVLTAAGLRGL